MSQLTYEASVYTRTVKYTNYKGETKEQTLYFALDPIQLMRVISTFTTKPSKSKNPAKQGQSEPISEDDQLKFVQDLAARAAGYPSDNGEEWEPYDNFQNSIAGKAFMTQLAASDGDRKEFADKVILDPFRSFVGFAKADPSNNAAETKQFDKMLVEMENVFKTPDLKTESLEERKARLAAELDALQGDE